MESPLGDLPERQDGRAGAAPSRDSERRWEGPPPRIPAIGDRVVQGAFKLILQAIWFREGRSPRTSTKSAAHSRGLGARRGALR